jgi:hypothetical protein
MSRRHLIISGTGRAGTTFLVQLMTELGMDTGFADTRSGVFSNCDAGMERDIRDPDCPYVVKSPRLCHDLEAVLRDRSVVVDHAIVPIRNLYAAAESRRNVTLRSGTSFGSGEVPGGLWLTSRPDQQESVLAVQFHQLMLTITAFEIPITMLQFPRLIKDPNYLWEKLAPLLDGIGPEHFAAAFRRVVRPELIHNFGEVDQPITP